MDGEGEGHVSVAGEVGGDPAAATEGGVQAAIGIIARQGEVIISAGKRPPRYHQLAVGLNGDGEGHVRVAREVGGHPAVAVEGGVEIARGSLHSMHRAQGHQQSN